MAKADVDISVGINDKAIVAALNNLGRKFDQFGKQAERSTRQAAKGVASMTDALYLFERRIATVTRAFQLLGAGASLAVFKNFVDQAQSANNAIRSITETQDQFNALQKETLKTANKTGEAFKATATGVVRVYRSIEGLGGTAAQAIKVVDTLNKTLVVSGATGSEATSTVIQFTQALQSGVLQGDELRSLRENAPLAMKAIAKAAGVTTAELKKLGSEGRLTTAILLKAFTDKEFIKQLNEMRDRMDRTFSQSLAVAANNFAIFFSKLEESTGILAKTGNAIVALSSSLNALAANKFLIGAAASLAVLAKFGPVIASLGSASLIASSSVTILGLSIARATVAVRAFIATNAPLLIISAVVLTIASAFDRANKAAEETRAKVVAIREEFALQNMKFNEVLDPKELDKLTELQTKLELNKRQIEEINKTTKENTKLMGQGSEASIQARAAAVQGAERAIKALEAENVALGRAIQGWKGYAKSVEDSNKARSIIAEGQDMLKTAETRLAVAKEANITGDQELARMKVEIGLKEKELALLVKAGDTDSVRHQLAISKLEPMRQAYDITKKAIELENKKKPSTKREDNTIANLMASYAAEMAKARTEAEGLQKIMSAMQEGVSEDALASLREDIDLRVRIIELRKQYAKLPGGTAELEKQLELNNKLSNGLRDDVKVYQLLQQARQDIVDISYEEYAAVEELAALQRGATEAELEDLRAMLAIREKYSLLSEKDIEQLIKADKARRTALETLELTREKLEQLKELGNTVGQAFGEALGSIITKAQTAEEAIRSLVAQLLIAIAKAAILRAFGEGGAGGFWSTVGNVITGNTRNTSPNIRIINLQGGGISSTTSPSGDVTIVLGQMASAIQRGGNPLALAIERTYGIGRRGV